eukprot:m.119208 g.119208  ORF g.119208 m.119208 type:complete len:87 (-) comp52047_c0_seq4:120-380(-)
MLLSLLLGFHCVCTWLLSSRSRVACFVYCGVIACLVVVSGRFSLWVDDCFLRGTSHRSLTFLNESLSSTPDFTIDAVEAWSLLGTI